MTHRPAALALVFLAGCFKPYDDLQELDFSEIAFENDLLEVNDATVSSFDVGLVCPDGEPARVLTVARQGLDEAQPVAVVLHSGAFDLVDPADIEGGSPVPGAATWRADSRLTRDWSVAKVWELLGINPTPVDPGEAHAGALPAALTNAGVIQVYPANCWGDLWHGSQTLDNGDEVPELEDGILRRDGLTLAAWTMRMLSDSDFAAEQGFSLPLADTSDVTLVALGDGARGAGELLSGASPVAPTALLLDSPKDALLPLVDAETADDTWVDGLLDIYGYDLAAWETASDRAADLEELRGQLDTTTVAARGGDGLLPARSGVVWSSIDPQVPVASAQGVVGAVSATGGWVSDTGARAHIQLSASGEQAADAVTYLREGVEPSDLEGE